MSKFKVTVPYKAQHEFSQERNGSGYSVNDGVFKLYNYYECLFAYDVFTLQQLYLYMFSSYSKCYLDVCAVAQRAVIVPDSRWHNGRLESSERYSDQQGRHASKDEAVTTCSVCRTV